MKTDSQFFRSVTQAAFALLCIWIGIEFYLFMNWGLSGVETMYTSRPPGAEGFLPISALISLKYWFQTGIITDIHPSGLFIFIAIVAIGLLLKKAFCSWLCPVGTLSEALWIVGKNIFRKNLTPSRWLDIPLRSIKYLLLGFFVWSILQMDASALRGFIYSPYNKVADIKMYLFFANITTFSLWTILIFMVLSVFIKNFWCRYLCPYGALLGALSWLSPMKITRNNATCIDCELCTKACPANIRVHRVSKVWSDECTNCLSCVQVCPVKDTLDIRTSITKTKVPNWVFGSLVIGVFIAITGLAILTGHWQNNISKQEYLKRFHEIESPVYQHFRGQVPEYGPND
jgi:polyferredoxin